MSNFAEQVHRWFELGFWSLARIEFALSIGKITKAEFSKITKKKK